MVRREVADLRKVRDGPIHSRMSLRHLHEMVATIAKAVYFFISQAMVSIEKPSRLRTREGKRLIKIRAGRRTNGYSAASETWGQARKKFMRPVVALTHEPKERSFAGVIELVQAMMDGQGQKSRR